MFLAGQYLPYYEPFQAAFYSLNSFNQFYFQTY